MWVGDGWGSVDGGETHRLASQHLLYMKGVAGPRHFLEWEQMFGLSDRKVMGGWS